MRRGFSLLELGVVLVISGLVMGFVLQATEYTEASECYSSTKTQVYVIRTAVDQFARKNNRLPLPAARNIGVEDANYGREASGAAIDEAGAGASTVSWGAVPFQALGLAPSFAGDCWGNKFTYVVTKSLTTSDASTGYLKDTVVGAIVQKSSDTITFNATTAYAIISHGEDGRGAVKLNYSSGGKGWCAGATIRDMNCNPSTSIAAAFFNNGKDAGNIYFDDLVITGGKPQIITETMSNAYCWGSNTFGELGDNSTVDRAIPAVVNGGIMFASISVGREHTCGLDITGKAYCWGMGSYGRLGDGDSTNHTALAPIEVQGGLTFTSIVAGTTTTCGLVASGQAYCWGYAGTGGIGNGVGGAPNTPQAVSNTCTGGCVFTRITVGDEWACGLTAAGKAWCWGWNYIYQVGDGSAVDKFVPTEVVGGLTFKSISAKYRNTCGITTTDQTWCWGHNYGNQLGTPNPPITYSDVPRQIDDTSHIFTKIEVGINAVCAVKADQSAWCWGDEYGAGQGHTFMGYSNPQSLGFHRFTDISSGCGIKSDGSEWCWSYPAGSHSPVSVDMTNVSGGAFGSLGTNSGAYFHQCSLTPLPSVGWSYNAWGEVGDGTTSKVNTITRLPQYAWPTSQPDHYFKYVTGGNTRCGITDTGKAYCWGYNGYGGIGNGTNTPVTLPTLVSFPAGVTSWRAINTSMYFQTCAIADTGANANKLYCWGSGWGDVSRYTPFLINTTCPGNNVASMYGQQYTMNALCTDGLTVSEDRYGGVAIPARPVGTTLVHQIARNYYQVCVLVDHVPDGDGQIYCTASGYANDVIGDGSPKGSASATFVHVPPTGTATKFTAIAAPSGNADGSSSFCALGDDQKIYCWGQGNGTGTDPAGVTAALVPTAVTATTGVTKFLNLRGNEGYNTYVTALGIDNQTYAWGQVYYDHDWPSGWNVVRHQPTPLPLPLGATGYKGIGAGGLELVY